MAYIKLYSCLHRHNLPQFLCVGETSLAPLFTCGVVFGGRQRAGRDTQAVAGSKRAAFTGKNRKTPSRALAQ